MSLDWPLVKGPRPADEALQKLDELAPDWPPGSFDLGRAVLLAMLDRIDEAWPLAGARARHLREVTGGLDNGLAYLAAIAMIEGDRERACRHHADLIEALPPGSDGGAASYRLLLARDLFYLGRIEEGEPVLRKAQGVPLGVVGDAVTPAVTALFFAARGDFEQAETMARAGVAVAQTGTENPWFQAWGWEDLATVLELAGRADDARGALERAVAVWERKRCLPCAARLRQKIDSLSQAKA